MKMVYISHPYTGDEEKNIKEAHSIATKLSKQFPSIVFINPLDSMKHLETAKLEYDIVIKQCIELMNRCDAMIMTGDWEKSKGCLLEFANAKIHIYNNIYEFLENVDG